ncbi:MAG: hypothetical protein ACRDOL_06380 [Streptosporangiaceae bacterium]
MRPQSPAAEDPANVYIYRDGGQQVGAAGPDESDAAYWYGRREEEDQPAAQQDTRGPFEPLVSSTAPPPDPSADASRPDPLRSGTLYPDAVPADTIPADAVPRADGPDDPGRAQARKLEQIKDFYLTAEAIGEENLDKHFDQLLAHQRELIGDYFRQSAAAKLGGAAESEPPEQAARPEAVPDEPFVAEKPRA